MLPEIALNVMGTLWMYSSIVPCINSLDTFANASIGGEKRREKAKRNDKLESKTSEDCNREIDNW
jgi:hypothetical protein